MTRTDSTRDAELMQRADGEPVRDGASELTAADRAKLEAIGELGELVRGHLELAADDVPDAKFAAVWREIDKRIDERPAGLLRRLSRWFDRYRGHIITGAVSAGAVAAIALWIHSPGGDPGAKAGSGGPIDVRAAAYRPAELESLDTPGGTGTVFNLEDEDTGRTTTVIWVTPQDQDTVEGI